MSESTTSTTDTPIQSNSSTPISGTPLTNNSHSNILHTLPNLIEEDEEKVKRKFIETKSKGKTRDTSPYRSSRESSEVPVSPVRLSDDKKIHTQKRKSSTSQKKEPLAKSKKSDSNKIITTKFKKRKSETKTSTKKTPSITTGFSLKDLVTEHTYVLHPLESSDGPRAYQDEINAILALMKTLKPKISESNDKASEEKIKQRVDSLFSSDLSIDQQKVRDKCIRHIKIFNDIRTRGEKIEHFFEGSVAQTTGLVLSPTIIIGSIAITGTRIHFLSDEGENPLAPSTTVSLPYFSIAHSAATSTTQLHIYCKDFRSMQFGFLNNETLEKFHHIINGHSNLKKNTQPRFQNEGPFFDPEEELKRLGYKEEFGVWQVLKGINTDYQYPNLPPDLVLPKILIDQPEQFSLEKCEAFNRSMIHRYKKKFPLFCWGCWDVKSPFYGCVISRCERPLASLPVSHSGQFRPSMTEDFEIIEAMFLAVNTVRQRSPNTVPELLQVIDTGAEDNKMNVSYAPFCEFTYLKLPMEKIQRSYNLMYMDVVARPFDPKNAVQLLKNSHWNQHIITFLDTAKKLQNILLKSGNLLIQSGGPVFDVDASLSCLVQILSDPYYRTIEGFSVLIEKEWLLQSYPFKHPNRPYTSFHRSEGIEAGPPVTVLMKDWDAIFFHFIYCVWQILQENTTKFEFKEEFLIFFLDSLFDSRFGTFLFNTEKDRQESGMPSFFNHIRTPKNHQGFRNPAYIPPSRDNSIILQLYSVQSVESSICLWSSYLFRWIPELSKRMEKLKEEIDRQAKKNKKLFLEKLNFLFVENEYFQNNEGCISSVSFRYNYLNNVPAGVLLLTSLKELVLSGNNITYVSDLYRGLSQLEILDLSSNQITSVPGEIWPYMYTLKDLYLSGNKIDHASLSRISYCTSLEVLVVKDNDIQYIPTTWKDLTRIRVLDLTSNKISVVPYCIIRSLTNLKTINLSTNNLTQLPDNFSDMKSLEVVDFSSNRLRKLPNTIGLCPALLVISAASNFLSEVPPSLGTSTTLEVLSLEHNNLSDLPYMGKCWSLKTLELSFNGFQKLPNLKECVSLNILGFEENQIEKLSPYIGHCTRLKKLNVAKNKIEELPIGLVYLTQLHELRIDGNNIKSPPPGVIDPTSKNIQPLFEYLNSLLRGNELIYRIKMMIIGPENVGKTSLVKSVTRRWHKIGDNKEVIEQEEKEKDKDKESDTKQAAPNLSTDGIDISTFQFELKDEKKKKISFPKKKIVGKTKEKDKDKEKPTSEHKKVNVSVWDFAGQNVYQTTHQFFLTTRSIYILTADLLDDKCELQIEFWLNCLKARSPGVPVLIVGTHLDLIENNVATEKMNNILHHLKKIFRHTFTSLDYFLVSCLSNEGIDKLRGKIQDLITQQKYMGEEKPKSYLFLEQFLMEKKAKKKELPIIGRAKLLSMGALCGLSSDESMECAQWLAQTGSIVFFHQDPVLKNTIILDPRWLTRMMATLFTTKHRWIKNGILEHSCFPQIWKEYPPHIHTSLLYLLTKFEICYELRGQVLNNILELLTDSPVPRQQHSTPRPVSFETTLQTPKEDKKEEKKKQDQHTQSGERTPSDISEEDEFVNHLEEEGSPHLIAEEVIKSDRGSPPFIDEANKDEFCCSLVTALLPTERPVKKLEAEWPTFPGDHPVKVFHFDRIYEFTFIPYGFFSRLLVKLLNLCTPLALWGGGILSTTIDRNDRILVETGEDKKNSLIRSLTIQVRCTSMKRSQNLFFTIIDLVDSLIEEWPQLHYSRYSFSSHDLLDKIANPTKYSIDELEEATLKTSTPPAQMTPSALSLPNLSSLNSPLPLLSIPSPLPQNSSAPPTTPVSNPPQTPHTPHSPHIPPTPLTPSSHLQANLVAPDISFSYLLDEHGNPIVPLIHLKVYTEEEKEREEDDDGVIGEIIGIGGFATVYKVNFGGREVAVKKLNPQTKKDPLSKKFREFRREIMIHSALKHPNIVELIAVSVNPFAIVTEFMQYGNLNDLLHNDEYSNVWTWALIVKMATDITKGLAYLHKRNPPVAHLDLKSPNVMVCSLSPSGSAPHYTCAKLADFGTAVKMNLPTISGRFVDNPIWLAPEILSNGVYNESVDVYALGIILWELITHEEFCGHLSFLSDIEDYLLKGNRPPIPPYSASYSKVIECCWDQNPATRPSLDWVLQQLGQSLEEGEANEAALIKRMETLANERREKQLLEAEEERKRAEAEMNEIVPRIKLDENLGNDMKKSTGPLTSTLIPPLPVAEGDRKYIPVPPSPPPVNVKVKKNFSFVRKPSQLLDKKKKLVEVNENPRSKTENLPVPKLLQIYDRGAATSRDKNKEILAKKYYLYPTKELLQKLLFDEELYQEFFIYLGKLSSKHQVSLHLYYDIHIWDIIQQKDKNDKNYELLAHEVPRGSAAVQAWLDILKNTYFVIQGNELLFSLDSAELEMRIFTKLSKKEDLNEIELHAVFVEVKQNIANKFSEFCSATLQSSLGIHNKNRKPRTGITSEITLADVLPNQEIFENFLALSKNDEERDSLLLFRDIFMFKLIPDNPERKIFAEEILSKFPSSFIQSEKEAIQSAIAQGVVSADIFDPVATYLHTSIFTRFEDFLEDLDKEQINKKGVLSKLKIPGMFKKKVPVPRYRSGSKRGADLTPVKKIHFQDLIKSSETLKTEYAEFEKFLTNFEMEKDLAVLKQINDFTNKFIDSPTEVQATSRAIFSDIKASISQQARKRLTHNELEQIEQQIESGNVCQDVFALVKTVLESQLQHQYSLYQHQNM